jgi:serine O-acetyltransferase
MSQRLNPVPLTAPLYPGIVNQNPRGIGLLSLIAEDFRTHDSSFLSPGFWAVAVHRFGNWRMGVRSPWLRAPLTLAYRTSFHGVIALWGIELAYNVKVGRRLRLGHHGCMQIGAREIGDDVIIQHSVTMGLRQRYAEAFPTIGNGVEVGPGACIVGGVHIGEGSYVGANTVVVHNLRPGSAVLGIPPRPLDLRALATPAAPAPEHEEAPTPAGEPAAS